MEIEAEDEGLEKGLRPSGRAKRAVKLCANVRKTDPYRG